MISPSQREHAEKTRSALAASKTTQRVVLPSKTVARYLAPPEDTVHPLEYAYHLLGDVNGKTVLEYGCGEGVNMVMMCRRGADVIGLDISPELLTLAKERLAANQCHRAMLVRGSAHALPLRDESVDVVFGIAILHHLDLEVASAEVLRVLKKGGRAIFKEPVRNSKWLAQIRRLLPKRKDVSPFERPLTDEQLREFASACRYRARTFHLMLSRLATLVPFLKDPAVKLCERLDGFLLRLFPSLTYYGSVKVFEIAKR